MLRTCFSGQHVPIASETRWPLTTELISFLSCCIAHIRWEASRVFSWAQDAREAPSRPIHSCRGVRLSWKSRRHVTRSIEGRDCRTLSESSICPCIFFGISGCTVNRNPQPFTELSLLNVHESSSPTTRISWAQSAESRPDLTAITAPELSLMTSTSCRLSVEHL